MGFQPATKIYIGSVPFDQTYKDVYLLTDRAKQEAHFKSLCPMVLRRGDYTYQRLDDAVVVPGNAETYYGYNYCMFQNTNYGSRWFYSFITDVEYVSPESTRLYLSLDVMQTWFPNCTVKPCLVEREHVDDDTVGRHVKNEGIDPGALHNQTRAVASETEFVTVVSSTVEIAVGEGAEGIVVNNRGDVYGKVYSGASRSVFADVGGHDALTDFGDFIYSLSSFGQQDAISEAYMIPKWTVVGNGYNHLYDKDGGFGFWLRNRDDSLHETKGFSVPVTFDTCDGYRPKNAKLFTYPFCKLVATSMYDQQEYACEYFDGVEGARMGSTATMEFVRDAPYESDGCEVMYARNYNGLSYNVDAMVRFPPYPTVSWVYQTFSNMYNGGLSDKLAAAQQNAQTSFKSASANAVAQGVGSAVGGVLMGALIGGVPGLLGKAAVGITRAALTAGKTTAAVGTLMGSAQGALTGAGGYDQAMQSANAEKENALRNARTELAVASLSPNTTKGALNSTASTLNMGLYAVYFDVMRPRAEIAKIIDDYFSMYGYSVQEIKKPNITGRRSWNYVKTSGANVTGAVPASALKLINGLLDSGVTFWHTPDVGNYELDNSIV